MIALLIAVALLLVLRARLADRPLLLVPYAHNDEPLRLRFEQVVQVVAAPTEEDALCWPFERGDGAPHRGALLQQIEGMREAHPARRKRGTTSSLMPEPYHAAVSP